MSQDKKDTIAATSPFQTSPENGPENGPESGLENAKHRLKGRRLLLFVLKLLVSAALIGWILATANLSAVGEAMVGVDLRWLGLAMGLQFVGAALITLRWQRLLAVKDVTPGFRHLFSSVVASSFFRQFLPSIIGGDAIRGYDAWRAGAGPGLAVMSLVVDRLAGLFALAIFALGAGLFFDDFSERLPDVRLWVLIGIGTLTVLLGGVFLPSRFIPRRYIPGSLTRLAAVVPERVSAKITNTLNAVRMFEGHPGLLVYIIALSFLLQINVITFYWVLAHALGLGMDFSAFWIIVPLAIFVMMAPVTINGIGLREAVFIFLLGQWQIGQSEALAFAWLEYGSFLAFGLFGGLVYALRRSKTS